MLYELVFDIALTDRSVANRPLYEFTLANPGFRRRVQDVRYTRGSAWLTILIEGSADALAEYTRRFGRGPGTLGVETRPIAEGPGFALYYEKQRAPERDDEETIWHLVEEDVGTDARITYDTREGASRVTVFHEDREKLRAFYDRLVALDAYGEVRFVRVGPVAADAGPVIALDELRLLRAAWDAGYYDRPRRAGLRKLAAAVGIPFSTVGWRLRGLERAAIERLLRTEEDAFERDSAPRVAARGPSASRPASRKRARKG